LKSLKFSVFPLDESPGFVIYLTATKFKASLARAFQAGGFDITPEQWAILNRLWESEGQHQSTLAESTSKDRHNVARIVHLLEKNGFVYRKADPTDKRCQRVFLTDLGRSVKTGMIEIVLNHLGKAFEGMTHEEIETLMRLHTKVILNLQEADSPPASSPTCDHRTPPNTQ
jgi:DNA-binding MarR family transcriptional regulator